MQSKNRNLHVITLALAFGRIQQASLNPYTAIADADHLGAELRDTINRVLDSEYAQGYRAGGEYATQVAKEILKEMN